MTHLGGKGGRAELLDGLVLAAVSWSFSVLVQSLVLVFGACTAPSGVDSELRIWLAGDVHLGAASSDHLAQLPVIAGSGFGIVNLEGPLAQAVGPSSATTLVNSVGGLSYLDRHGVRVLGLANNHALDLGWTGAVGTALFGTASGFEVAGGLAGIAIVKQGHAAIAVTAHDLSGGVPANLEKELREAASRAQVLVATFHVTGPPSYLPRPELREAVELALVAGAHVVAAHGTHAIGPVERRGEQVVAWGLGNLVFECDCTEEQDALVLRLRINGGRIRAEVVPITAGLGGAGLQLSREPDLIVELLEKLASSPLTRTELGAAF